MSLKIAIISGDHPRHKYFVYQMSKISSFEIIWFRQKRINIVLETPDNLEKKLVEIFNHHFDLRKKRKMNILQIT